jgi:putative flippase GtrA
VVRTATAIRLRFGLVGVANTLVDLVAYTVLVAAGLPFYPANLISTSAGMALSFTLNRTFTFRAAGGDLRTQAVLFVLVTAAGLWLVQPLVITLCAGPFRGLSGVAAIVGPKLAGLAVGLVWNYTLYHRFVFRHRGSRA